MIIKKIDDVPACDVNMEGGEGRESACGIGAGG